MNSEIVLYRCSECGETSLNLGTLHAHAETHRGWRGFQWPWNMGDFGELMEYTEVLVVETVREVELEEVGT